MDLLTSLFFSKRGSTLTPQEIGLSIYAMYQFQHKTKNVLRLQNVEMILDSKVTNVHCLFCFVLSSIDYVQAFESKS